MPSPSDQEDSAASIIPEAKGQDVVGLKVRSACVVVALVAFLMTFDGLMESSVGYYILVFFATFYGGREFYRMCRAKGASPMSSLGTVSGVVLLILQITCIRSGVPLNYVLSAASVAVMLTVIIGHMFTSSTEGYLTDVGATILGLLYVWFLGSFFFIGLRHLPHGYWIIVLMMACVKGGDVLAYAIGRKYGKTKLIPRISPNKSYEGAAACVIGSTLVSLVVNRLLAANGVALLDTIPSIVYGAVVGSSGIVGDLIESNFKRSTGAKDSSSLIASYGGVLDVIDSLMVAAPVSYFIMVAYGS